MERETAKTYLKEGNKLKRIGKLKEAIAYYQKAIKINPYFCWSHHYLGEALAKNGTFDEAINSFNHAIEINPNLAWSYYELGEAFGHQEEFDAAIINYYHACQLEPDNQRFERGLKATVSQYRFYAENQKNLGNLDRAVAAYQKLIEIQPQIDDYCQLGFLLVEKKHWDEALFCYEKLLQVQPWNSYKVELFLSLGVALVREGKLKQIIEIYHKKFKKNIQNLEFYYQFSIAVSAARLISEAVSFFKELPKPECPKPLEKDGKNHSIYHSIWDKLNQIDSENLVINPGLNEVELKSEKIQSYFSPEQVKTIQLYELQPRDINFLENTGLLLEYIKLIRIENHHLENIYINYFNSANEEIGTIANVVEKNYLRNKAGDCQYEAVEFTQSLVTDRYMYAVCPLSGRVVKSNTSFFLGKFFLAYRFVGEEVFYILINDFLGSKAGLYIPKINLCINCLSRKRQIDSLLQVVCQLQSYVVANWKEVQNYLRNSNKSLVELYGIVGNLGHFFWQDVTGIYYLYENNILPKIDYFCIGDYEYLSLLSIFPEVPKNKLLSISGMSYEEQFRYMLQNNFLCLRMTNAFIKQSLGKRIYQGAYNLSSIDFIEEVEKAKENNDFLLWINVRTHNKAWVGQEKGYAEIIDHLSNDFPNLSIGVVFDGTPDAINCVKIIIEQTGSKLNFYNTKLNIKIYESIVWANNIDAYISVVGSGLVITSWLNDKPGIAHSDKFHLAQEIFWSQVKEDAIPPVFLNEKEVEQIDNRIYGNYRVDWQVIYTKLLNIMKEKLEPKNQKLEKVVSKS